MRLVRRVNESMYVILLYGLGECWQKDDVRSYLRLVTLL